MARPRKICKTNYSYNQGWAATAFGGRDGHAVIDRVYKLWSRENGSQPHVNMTAVATAVIYIYILRLLRFRRGHVILHQISTVMQFVVNG